MLCWFSSALTKYFCKRYWILPIYWILFELLAGCSFRYLIYTHICLFLWPERPHSQWRIFDFYRKEPQIAENFPLRKWEREGRDRKGKKGTIIRPTIDTPASQQVRIKEAILSVQAATKMPQIKPIHQLSVTGILHEERLAAFKVSGKKKFIKPSAPRYRNCSTVSGSR